MKKKYCFVLMVALTLSGCFHLPEIEPAPVESLFSDKPITKGVHIVAKGETLYSIAWRYNQDFRDLAASNQIPEPYVIYAGQRLSLSAKQKIKQTYKPVKNKNYYEPPIEKRSTVYSQVPVQKSQEVTREVAKVETKTPVISKQITTITTTTETISTTKKEVMSPLTKWQWPVKGPLIKQYAPTGHSANKGVDIGGKKGTAVKAAASGKVVYAGLGLRGYGQLIIIKHNETYLSAYAHNNRLLVKEGDFVAQSQVISEMGHSDADQVKLHFEIRKNGRPINPLLLLPRA